MKRIVVTGSQGQLGQAVCASLTTDPGGIAAHLIATGRDTLDLSEPERMQAFFNRFPVDCILNCAAYTRVDQAEAEPEQAMRVNALAIQDLVAAAARCDAHIIHISTDYVFDGKKTTPYKETDEANPISVYGRSKREGEKHILAYARGTVIRTSWLYIPGRRNFVTTILSRAAAGDDLNVVADQTGSPTYASDVAAVLGEFVRRILKDGGIRETGLFHYSNAGQCSWYEFARAIVELAGIRCRIHPIKTTEYPLPAKRPRYSVLDTSKIRSLLGREIPHWRDSLVVCLPARPRQGGHGTDPDSEIVGEVG